MDLGLSEIKKNMAVVQERIGRAAYSVGRDPDGILLVVVTKGHSVEVVSHAIEAGVRCFGENYVEEAAQKIQAVNDQRNYEWHMIGHIQSRKARQVCELFHFVHSIDSIKLAERLNRFMEEYEWKLPILLECNVSGEQSKFGWPAWEEDRWEDLLPEFSQIASLQNILIQGLMTMAPITVEVEYTRPYFQRLRYLQEYLGVQLPGSDWGKLSMGMSADYEIAIQEGANIVRIGTAILGKRR
jgi:pyridoxal phosphate enzyme (YggS family)